MDLPRLFLFLLPPLLAFAPSHARAEILRVSKTGDGSNGQSWETAYHRIGDAVQAATHGDVIWVASGTSNGTVILPSGVSLYGGFNGLENNLRDPWSNLTTVDANGYVNSGDLILFQGQWRESERTRR
jgi:hypothetical protein